MSERIPTNLKLNDEVRDALSAAAEAHGKSIVRLGNLCIADALSRLIDPEEVKLFSGGTPNE